MKRAAVLLAGVFVFLAVGCGHGKTENIKATQETGTVFSADVPTDSVLPVTAEIKDISPMETESTVESKMTTESTDESPAEEITKEYDDLSALEEIIYDRIYNSGGEWSVYVQDLETGAELDINPMNYYPASLIKLYALAACYEEIEAGNIDEDSVYPALENMIELSDNEAFNSIVWQLGAYYITNWCQENGYDDTIQCHGLYPAWNADGLQIYIGSGYNTTTAADCGHLLSSMYRGECVSEHASRKMIDILSKQDNRNKIPAGLPEGVRVANKTGETETECHDAAIVYSDGGDYVLVVMIESYYYDAYGYEDDIAMLSNEVYDYFNR